MRSITESELTKPLTTYDETIDIVRRFATPLESESALLRDAGGRILASPVVAPIDVPPFDNSAMDGYAVFAADYETPGISVTGALHISTGAPLPPGMDSVVPWEDTNESVTTKAVTPGQHIRPQGAEARAGDAVLQPGTRLHASHLGVLASLGYKNVDVIRRPRVAIGITGNELQMPGEALGVGQIFSSNHEVLHRIVKQSGGEVVDLALLRDNEPDITAWLQRVSQQADIVVTSGGASVGQRDWTRSVIEDQGTFHVWKVSMKPGKPFGFATVGNARVLLLPGNPGAVMTCAQLYLVPLIHALAGQSFDSTLHTLTLQGNCPGDNKRTYFQPVRIAGAHAVPLQGGSSQLLSPFLEADGLAAIAPRGCVAGSIVDVRMIVQ